jgi:hypothetical protein
MFKILAVVGILLVVAAGGTLIYTILPRHAVPVEKGDTSAFVFESSKASGWWTAGIIDSGSQKPSQSSNAPVPTKTMIIAQGTKEQPTGDCFVEFNYWADSSKDLSQAFGDIAAAGSPDSLVPTKVTDHAMKTDAVDTPYQVHQYSLTGPDVAQMSTGEEFAVLKAGTGYVDIRGYCETADQLAVIEPVFSAVSFRE